MRIYDTPWGGTINLDRIEYVSKVSQRFVMGFLVYGFDIVLIAAPDTVQVYADRGTESETKDASEKYRLNLVKAWKTYDP